jgi:hypothetical protein
MYYPIEFNLAQLFGLVGFGIGLLAFYQKEDEQLKFFMVLLFINQTVHFFLLGAHTAATSSCINLIRTLVATKVNSLSIAIVFIGLNVIFGVLFAQSLLAFFPIVAASIGTYSLFCLNGIKMRFALLIGSFLWLCNNIIVGSIGGIMLEVMVIIINLHTIIRLYNVNDD